VTRIDDTPIGNGGPGLTASRLRQIFHTAANLAA
jgi:hypothetical protein